jgi:hypothetical protein
VDPSDDDLIAVVAVAVAFVGDEVSDTAVSHTIVYYKQQNCDMTVGVVVVVLVVVYSANYFEIVAGTADGCG